MKFLLCTNSTLEIYNDESDKKKLPQILFKPSHTILTSQWNQSGQQARRTSNKIVYASIMDEFEFDKPINQSINQVIDHSSTNYINQSINQLIDTSDG